MSLHIRHIGFLTPGSHTDGDAWSGLEHTLQLFEHGEHLGLDSAWVRQRHLEPAVSSAATLLAAASQRTRRIELGTAVIQMGYENPFRLAEDLSTVDVLSRGRLQVGLSAGAPNHGELLGERFFDGDPAHIDHSHQRVARLRENLRGAWFGTADTVVTSPAGHHRPRVQPHAPGLAQRLWYGGGSLRSAEWAGRNGFNLLIGNLNTGEQTDHFFEAQLAQLQRFHNNWSSAHAPRVAVGRVIVPTDSADAASRQMYQGFATSRHARTLAPQGDRRVLYSRDLVGHSDQILEWLLTDPVLPLVSELRLELPYNFPHEAYLQLLTDFVERIAPELGWSDSLASLGVGG
jgi:alkanesulfonate monooxygenase SsuD/methylene tetrahydromethanopterin reductase-like flavin-dependent oxidoreductase (luciferase family)